MFDQAGMVREFVKWDYEMKRGDQVAGVVDRALELATASPTGPVYLTLPRAVLGEEVADTAGASRSADGARPAAPSPAPADVERLADWIAAARMSAGDHRPGRPRPAQGGGADPHRRALRAARWCRSTRGISRSPDGIRCSRARRPARCSARRTSSSGIESDVPWIPSLQTPAPDARIVQIGEDPLYHRYPMRSFRSDLAVVLGTLALLEALEPALAARLDPADAAVAARRAALSARSEKLQAGWEAEIAAAGRAAAINAVWLNHCLRDVIEADTMVVNEYSFRQEYCPLAHPGSLFLESDRRAGSAERCPGGARPEARGTGPHGGRPARRRRLHVRQPHRLP